MHSRSTSGGVLRTQQPLVEVAMSAITPSTCNYAFQVKTNTCLLAVRYHTTVAAVRHPGFPPIASEDGGLLRHSRDGQGRARRRDFPGADRSPVVLLGSRQSRCLLELVCFVLLRRGKCEGVSKQNRCRRNRQVVGGSMLKTQGIRDNKY